MNKKVLVTFFALATCCFQGCKKSGGSSDSPSSNPNGFRIDNVFYNTEKAGFAAADGNFSLIFYSGTVSFDINAQQWKGTGHAVLFDELTSGNLVNGFPVGTFLYGSGIQNGYFTDAMTRTKYNFSADTGVERNCVKGDITITKTGSGFQVRYNLTNDDSSRVTGEYNGTPPDITGWFSGKK
jgi:hypothetical protein